mmetsp:Transcript_3856/g.12788  ORF Transcript_3856/g.12788 Transcript_3856/m.12788 type:complete len:367 (+) Transcript_3856:802-1902(+)
MVVASFVNSTLIDFCLMFSNEDANEDCESANSLRDAEHPFASMNWLLKTSPPVTTRREIKLIALDKECASLLLLVLAVSTAAAFLFFLLFALFLVVLFSSSTSSTSSSSFSLPFPLYFLNARISRSVFIDFTHFNKVPSTFFSFNTVMNLRFATAPTFSAFEPLVGMNASGNRKTLSKEKIARCCEDLYSSIAFEDASEPGAVRAIVATIDVENEEKISIASQQLSATPESQRKSAGCAVSQFSFANGCNAYATAAIPSATGRNLVMIALLVSRDDDSVTPLDNSEARATNLINLVEKRINASFSSALSAKAVDALEHAPMIRHPERLRNPQYVEFDDALMSAWNAPMRSPYRTNESATSVIETGA